MNCLTKLFQQKRRRIGYIQAFSGPMISKRDSSDFIFIKHCFRPVSYTHLDVYKRQLLNSDTDKKEEVMIKVQIINKGDVYKRQITFL